MTRGAEERGQAKAGAWGTEATTVRAEFEGSPRAEGAVGSRGEDRGSPENAGTSRRLAPVAPGDDGGSGLVTQEIRRDAREGAEPNARRPSA